MFDPEQACQAFYCNYWSYARRKDLCDEHTEASGNSYLADQVADQLADIPPQQRHVVAKNGNLRFLLLELILPDQLADLPPPSRGI